MHCCVLRQFATYHDKYLFSAIVDRLQKNEDDSLYLPIGSIELYTCTCIKCYTNKRIFSHEMMRGDATKVLGGRKDEVKCRKMRK